VLLSRMSLLVLTLDHVELKLGLFVDSFYILFLVITVVFSSISFLLRFPSIS
jgi:hypothetical protein